jgi:hypothetical protein
MPLQPCAGALLGDHPVVAHRIVDDAGDAFAIGNHRGDDAEGWNARGEIEGAVDGIDDDRQRRVLELAEQRGIGCDGLLADEQRLRPAHGNLGLDHPLGFEICLRNQIGRLGLGAHVVAAEPAEARQYFRLRCPPQEIGKRGDIYLGNHGSSFLAL